MEQYSLKRTKIIKLAVIALLPILLYLRHPNQILHPQFWVEGSYIYGYSNKMPLFEYLFSPLYGYLMIPQRLIVVLFTPLVAIEYHPRICVAVSVLITLLIPIYFIRTPSRLPVPIFFALAIFLSPLEGAEIFNKLLYLMWVLPISLLFLLFRDDKLTKNSILLMDICWIVSAGLSGPLVLLFVPAFIFVCILRGSKYFFIVTSVVCLCAIAQILYLIGYPQSVSNQSMALLDIQKLFDSLTVYVFPQYFVPKVALAPTMATIFTLLFFSSLYFLNKKHRREAYILFILLFSFLIPAMIKLAPFFHYISGSRYLYFPYLCITFYLLFMIQKGGRTLKLIAIPCLFAAFIFHLPYFQLNSTDYKWKEHLSYAKANHCKARIPIPYTGKEGVAWTYEHEELPRNFKKATCNNRHISDWLGGTSEKITLLGSEKSTLSTKLNKAVFSLKGIQVSPDDTLVDFSLSVKVERAYQHQIGIKFYNDQNKVIKEVSDRLDISAKPSFVAKIPQGTKYLRPYLRLGSKNTIEVSDVRILIL